MLFFAMLCAFCTNLYFLVNGYFNIGQIILTNLNLKVKFNENVQIKICIAIFQTKINITALNNNCRGTLF